MQFQVQNVLQDLNGTPIPNVKVFITLYADFGFKMDDGSEITPVEQTLTDSSGKWSVLLESNDNITPSGTLYRLEEQVPKNKGNTRIFFFRVSNTLPVPPAINNVKDLLVPEVRPLGTTGMFLTQDQAEATYAHKGEVGPIGPAGPQGIPGNTGPTGPVGPQGPQGTPGVGIVYKGNVATVGALPPTGNAVGDAYSVTAQPGYLYIWSGTVWNQTTFQGPPGATGATGATGPVGPQGQPGPNVVSANAPNLSVLGSDGFVFTRKFYTISSSAPSGGNDGDVWYLV
jgi:hypothetical protein